MKILQAVREIEFAAKLFAAAGFTSFDAAFAAKDESALKAHLDAAVAAAPAKTVEKVVEKTVEPTAEQLQALVHAELRSALKLGAQADVAAELVALSGVRAQLATAVAQLGAIRAAKVEFAADAKPEAVSAALDSRIKLAAGEELAKRGLGAFPEQHPVDDPTRVNAPKLDPKLTGLDRTRAALEAERAGKK